MNGKVRRGTTRKTRTAPDDVECIKDSTVSFRLDAGRFSPEGSAQRERFTYPSLAKHRSFLLTRPCPPPTVPRRDRTQPNSQLTVVEEPDAPTHPHAHTWETVYGFFWRWNRAGVVTHIRDQLSLKIRTGKGRCPHPVTLIVDSQSVKGASTVGRNSRGYDAAKKINGRERHITVDTLGLPVMITVTPADIQDRDATRDISWRLRLTQPRINQVWADRCYAGDLVDWARDRLWLSLRIVSRPKHA